MLRLNNRRKQLHQFKETARTDPYRADSKPTDSPQCAVCKAVSVAGRWVPPGLTRKSTRVAGSKASNRLKCPACQQLKDHYAMGVLELHGENWKKKSGLVLNTIKSTEKIARSKNDQQRILWTHENEGVTKIYVTLPELARHLGRQLGKSFKGKVQYVHSTEEPYIRVKWWSDHPSIQSRVPHKSKSLRGRGNL